MKNVSFRKFAFLCAAMLLGTAAQTFAQDIIVKGNGEELKTKVMEVSPETIKYKMWDYQDGPVYTLPTSDVFMIKYQNGNKDVMNEYSSSMPVRKSAKSSVSYPHYRGELNFGYALGLDGAADRIVFETIHGTKINKYAFVGVGTGFHAYPNILTYDGYSLSETWAMTVPIFLDLKGFIPVSDDFSPYIDLGLGGSIGVMEIESSGFLANVGFGINYKKFNVGMNFQSDQKVKGFNFKIGVVF